MFTKYIEFQWLRLVRLGHDACGVIYIAIGRTTDGGGDDYTQHVYEMCTDSLSIRTETKKKKLNIIVNKMNLLAVKCIWRNAGLSWRSQIESEHTANHNYIMAICISRDHRIDDASLSHCRRSLKVCEIALSRNHYNYAYCSINLHGQFVAQQMGMVLCGIFTLHTDNGRSHIPGSSMAVRYANNTSIKNGPLNNTSKFKMVEMSRTAGQMPRHNRTWRNH